MQIVFSDNFENHLIILLTVCMAYTKHHKTSKRNKQVKKMH